MARWILILLLKSIDTFPAVKNSFLRFLAVRPWLESHLKSFSYLHRLSLFDVADPGAGTDSPSAIVWADYDPAVHRLYDRLQQTRMRYETRH